MRAGDPVITALVILGAWQTVNALLLLGAARIGVLTIAVRRPAAPRKTEATP